MAWHIQGHDESRYMLLGFEYHRNDDLPHASLVEYHYAKKIDGPRHC
jgi:hypothetical protein